MQMKDVKILLPSIRFSFCNLSLFQKDNTKDIAEPITHLPQEGKLNHWFGGEGCILESLETLLKYLPALSGFDNLRPCGHIWL
jgi:hypothetical protein